jgi:hypothetical protein
VGVHNPEVVLAEGNLVFPLHRHAGGLWVNFCVQRTRSTVTVNREAGLRERIPTLVHGIPRSLGLVSEIVRVLKRTSGFGLCSGKRVQVTDLCLNSNCEKDIPITMFFTDTAFTSISKVSDTFAGGGLSYSLTGDVIELDWAGFPTSFPINTSEQAVLNLASGPVGTPESSSITMLSVALVGFAVLTLKKIS